MDEVNAKLFRRFFGSDANKIRFVPLEKHVVMFIGSNPELLKVFSRVLHHAPITIATHDYCNHWLRHDFLRVIPKKRAIITRKAPKKLIPRTRYVNIPVMEILAGGL
jgi:hypothetical protein